MLLNQILFAVTMSFSATEPAPLPEPEVPPAIQEISQTEIHLARLLVIASLGGKGCDVDANPSRVGKLVQDALEVNPAELENFKADKVFKRFLGGTLLYRQLAGTYEFEGRTTNLAPALVGTTFYGNAQGVYGNTTKIQFLLNGKIIYHRLDVETLEWSEEEGTWSSPSAKQIEIRVGKSTRHYTLIRDHECGPEFIFIAPEPRVENELPSKLYEFWSECEA